MCAYNSCVESQGSLLIAARQPPGLWEIGLDDLRSRLRAALAIEIEAPENAPVSAVHEGTVVFADRFRGYGLMVVLDHGGKHHSLYAHLNELRVQAGQTVGAGQVLGTTGSSLQGPGLYFEVRFQGRPEDPLEWLSRSESHTP